VPGGGTALVLAAAAVDDLDLTGDELVGAQIVKRSLDAPLRWIAENAGEQGHVIVAQVRSGGQGFNAATGEYGDLMAQGVIDPVKVTRSALQNAGSIAGLLLTTEALVVDKPAEEEDDTHSGHGHSHGPGGHAH
ncbi:MAG: TCP-1/cpn60 chaperonin family protein, partial [Actinomycetes bacterium]